MKIEVGMKFYLYQILGVLIIWLGMTYFLDDITGTPRIIYYAVTSWLLFLIVVTVRTYLTERKHKNKDENEK